jgi:regulator of nucleoside diphosphate kinase
MHVLEATAREHIPPAWALGVRASAPRRRAQRADGERELLEFMGLHARHIARVLNGALDFLDLRRRGELTVDARPCAMEEVCAAAIEELREIGFDARISYQAEGDGEGEWDPDRLAQAISYLIELAAGHAPPAAHVALRWRGDEDGVVVRVEAGRRATPSRIAPARGEDLDDRPEGDVRPILARHVALAHGGALARLGADGAASFVMALPRRAPGGQPTAVEPERRDVVSGRIYITSQELERLRALVDQHSEGRDGAAAERLGAELERAIVVDPERLPGDAVTVGSRVTFEDARTGSLREVVIVYPPAADASAGRVSVLAPIGAALIGQRRADVIDWPLPGGRVAELRILAVSQPAAEREPAA